MEVDKKTFGVSGKPLQNVLAVARKRCAPPSTGVILYAWRALVETEDGVYHTHWFNARRKWADRGMNDYWVGEKINLATQRQRTTIDDWESRSSKKGYTIIEDPECWPHQCVPHKEVCEQ
jgi:hypothetical protein